MKYKREDIHRTYDTPLGVLTLQTQRKRLRNFSPEQTDQEGNTPETFDGTISFRTKKGALSQQRMDSRGSFLSRPTIFFSAIVPGHSAVFKLVKADNLEELIKLFTSGTSKATDRDPEGRSLLHVRPLLF